MTIRKTITRKSISRWLPVALGSSELLDRARTMSQRCKEKDALEAEKAATTRDFGERLKKLGGEVARLSEVVSTGIENQNVECSELHSYRDRLVTITREDTGETVETRPLLESEMQMELPEGDEEE